MSSHRKEREGIPGLGTTDSGRGGRRESSVETSSGSGEAGYLKS